MKKLMVCVIVMFLMSKASISFAITADDVEKTWSAIPSVQKERTKKFINAASQYLVKNISEELYKRSQERKEKGLQGFQPMYDVNIIRYIIFDKAAISSVVHVDFLNPKTMPVIASFIFPEDISPEAETFQMQVRSFANRVFDYIVPVP